MEEEKGFEANGKIGDVLYVDDYQTVLNNCREFELELQNGTDNGVVSTRTAIIYEYGVAIMTAKIGDRFIQLAVGEDTEIGDVGVLSFLREALVEMQKLLRAGS